MSTATIERRLEFTTEQRLDFARAKLAIKKHQVARLAAEIAEVERLIDDLETELRPEDTSVMGSPL